MRRQWGAMGTHGAHYINKLPINRPSGPYVIICGPEYLSRKLDWVGDMTFGTGNVQNDCANASTEYVTKTANIYIYIYVYIYIYSTAGGRGFEPRWRCSPCPQGRSCHGSLEP